MEFLKVRDLPVLRELSFLQAVELKRLEADVIARRFDIPEFVYLRAGNVVNDGNAVTLGDHLLDRPSEVRKTMLEALQVAPDDFDPGSLSFQLVAVILRDDVIELIEVPCVESIEIPADDNLVIFNIRHCTAS